MNVGEGSYSFSDLRDTIKVGKYTSIARDCYFHERDDNHYYKVNPKVVYTYNWEQGKSVKADDIEIGNDVWVGQGVKFLPSVKVGNGAIIGAWSVIAKDVPPYAIVVGNPAKVIKYRFTEEQQKELERIKWWDWSDEDIGKAKDRRELDDIDDFIKKYA